MKLIRGTTLIELIIMIAIGSLLLIGASRAQQSLIEAAMDNRDALTAMYLAKRQAAIMWNSSYPSTTSGEAAQSTDSDFPDYVPTYEVTDVATNATHSLRQITIRIHKGSSTGPVLIRIDTYRSDIITFGNGT